jgi:hypothetical protein
VRRRARRFKQECRFERAISFDPTFDIPQILKEFPDAVFLGVDVESLVGEAEGSSLQTRVPVRKGITLDPIVGSPSNFHWSFRTLFSLE